MYNVSSPFSFPLCAALHQFFLSPCYIGILEYDEWSNHRQAWKLESAAIIEPPINFIVSSHSKGKRRWSTLTESLFDSNSAYMFSITPDCIFLYRPRWALIDKAYMHNTWRSSQSSYYLFRTNGNFCPSDYSNLLMDDLLNLSLHSYETVRAWVSNLLHLLYDENAFYLINCRVHMGMMHANSLEIYSDNLDFDAFFFLSFSFLIQLMSLEKQQLYKSRFHT